MHIEPIHLWRWIETKLEPNLLFIHWLTIESCTVMPPWTAKLSKLSLLGHHTRCTCHPRYELWWPVMLGHYWLVSAKKDRLPCTFHVVYYQWQGKENNWTNFSICFDTSRMLTWVEIVTWLQWAWHTNSKSITIQFQNFGSINAINVDSIHIRCTSGVCKFNQTESSVKVLIYRPKMYSW